MKKVSNLILFCLLMGIGVSTSAAEFSQPEYLGGFAGTGGGPRYYEQWILHKCLLKDNEKLVFGSGDNKLTFKIQLKSINDPKYNYHWVNNVDMYIGEDEKLFVKNVGNTMRHIYLVKSDNGDRHFVVDTSAHTSDIPDTMQIYTLKSSGQSIKHFTRDGVSAETQGYMFASFKDESIKVVGDKIVIDFKNRIFGPEKVDENKKQGQLIFTYNENAQLFEYETKY